MVRHYDFPPDDTSDGGRPLTFSKGVLTGLVLANFNKHLLLGGLLGLVAGMMYEQERSGGGPDVKAIAERASERFRNIRGGGNK